MNCSGMMSEPMSHLAVFKKVDLDSCVTLCVLLHNLATKYGLLPFRRLAGAIPQDRAALWRGFADQLSDRCKHILHDASSTATVPRNHSFHVHHMAFRLQL